MANDTWTDRLSEYVDGELDSATCPGSNRSRQIYKQFISRVVFCIHTSLNH